MATPAIMLWAPTVLALTVAPLSHRGAIRPTYVHMSDSDRIATLRREGEATVARRTGITMAANSAAEPEFSIPPTPEPAEAPPTDPARIAALRTEGESTVARRASIAAIAVAPTPIAAEPEFSIPPTPEPAEAPPTDPARIAALRTEGESTVARRASIAAIAVAPTPIAAEPEFSIPPTADAGAAAPATDPARIAMLKSEGEATVTRRAAVANTRVEASAVEEPAALLEEEEEEEEEEEPTADAVDDVIARAEQRAAARAAARGAAAAVSPTVASAPVPSPMAPSAPGIAPPPGTLMKSSLPPPVQDALVSQLVSQLASQLVSQLASQLVSQLVSQLASQLASVSW